MTFQEFKDNLKVANTEEDVKYTYAKYFNIKYDTSHHHDLYTPQVLFEFKVDKQLNKLKARATVLAQILYYVRRLKYLEIDKVIPYFLCIADKKEAIITETNRWSSYYSNDSYNWELPPSKPDAKLIDHLVKEPEIDKLHIYNINLKGDHNAFKKNLENALNPQMLIDFGDKKIINEENFEAVFEHWKQVLGQYIINGYKDSFYFLANIQKNKIIIDKENNKVVFQFEDGNSKIQKILMKDFEYFWNIYDYVDKIDVIKGIHAKLDRLTDESQRRFEGEFYTPLKFAKKAIHYFEKELGKNWFKTGEYRIWDMAAGTGNLEYHLPAESYKYLYLSTLHQSEADHLKRIFPEANCFQYDYLNDDVEYLFNRDSLPFDPNWKLPKKLREELADPDITWIVYINPPFATAQDARSDGSSKKGVSKTKIEKYMDAVKVGHTKRELYAQFMFRILSEFPKSTYLGMFSTLKYLNAPDSADYRDRNFNHKFLRGFVFHSKAFHGVTGDFPIGFLIWDFSKHRTRKQIKLDISDLNGLNIGFKHLKLINKKDVINNWFKRPQNSNEYILPPLSNALSVKYDNKDTRHRARPDFIASICSKGNDFQNAKYVTILSSPSVSAGAFSVIKENFEKALTLHAVRKIPKATWLNDRNQFLIPHTEPSKEFYNDCVVWSLFSNSNETSSLKDVEYLGKTYQIKNHFFPFKINEIQNWNIKEPNFKIQMSSDNDRFVANWLSEQKLSNDAKNVIAKAKLLYQCYFENLHNIITKRLKIETWDAGWYQIRKSLIEFNLCADIFEELNFENTNLANKIIPKIYEYGFLDKDEIYE